MCESGLTHLGLVTPHGDIHLTNLDEQKYPRPIYFQDDLTTRRAKIACQARQGKKARKLTDTWIIDSKVMVKDMNNRIHQVRTQKDIEHFMN